jgi:hypothetical protein
MGKRRHPWIEALHAPPLQPIPALARAQAATNAVSHYGSAQNWDAMAAELVVSGAIAQRFPDNPEIQLVRARCLLAQALSFHQFGLNTDVAAQDLSAHLERYSYLMKMPPFNQIGLQAG